MKIRLIRATILVSSLPATAGAHQVAGLRNERASAAAEAPAGRERSSTPDVILAAAGDIACDPSDRDFRKGKGTMDRCRQSATGRLLRDLNPDAVAALGDLQYEDGAMGKWAKSFHRRGAT